jgi:hypothetical protein
MKASTVVAAPVPCSKTCEEVLLDGGRAVLEVGVRTGANTVLQPVIPILGLKPVIHCCRGNHVPHSVEVTSKISSGIRSTCFQDCG